MKKWIYILVCFISLLNLSAQDPVETFQLEQFKNEQFEKYEFNKTIPKEIRPQALTALSFYPELRDVKITFRIRKRKTPLTSRPRIFSIFRKKKNRNYLITISSKTKENLTPILFSNLPYNAQIGVLGHELAHIANYNTKNTFQLLGLSFGMLSPKYVDKFEWNTDKRTIEHGLGYQLHDWSSYVRKALFVKEWRGASQEVGEGNKPSVNQRYMGPTAIINFMESSNRYKN